MKQYLITFFALLALIIGMSDAVSAKSPSHYTIVVDAGSSGTRLHLFYYDTTTPVPTIHDIFSISTRPGLSSFAKHPALASDSLQKLFTAALKKMAKAHIDPHAVTVTILGTAGMRLLPEGEQYAIYAQIKHDLTSSFPFQIGEIKTIPGKLEGIYGWLDVNYLAGHFQSATPTVGAIDVGGASLQISFATEDRSRPDDEETLQLNGQTYTVFSKSFLGLGQQEALKSVTQSAEGSACFPTGYQSTGHFNATRCAALYLTLLETYHIAAALPDLRHQSFIGFSGMYYTLHDFLGLDEPPTPATLEGTIATRCSETWDQLVTLYPEESAAHLSLYCGSSIFYRELLFDVLPLRAGQIDVQDKLKQQTIDWTLGSVLYALIH